jgi:hypothetical protein
MPEVWQVEGSVGILAVLGRQDGIFWREQLKRPGHANDE